MTERERKKQKDGIKRKLAEEFAGNFWKWRGTEFINFNWHGVSGCKAYVRFTIKMLTLKAEIESEQYYNVPDSVHMFVGDNAIEECIDWTAEKLMELYDTVTARTEPYKQGYMDYQKALQGR